jgi:hypothetical protein
MWNQSQTSQQNPSGNTAIPDSARRSEIPDDMYWQFEGCPLPHDKKSDINPFLEIISREWMAAIGVTDEQLRT